MKSPYNIGLAHCGISMMIYVYNQIEPDQSNGCDGEPWCAHSIASFEHTAGLQFSAFLVVKWLCSLPGTVSISNACFYHTRLLTPPGASSMLLFPSGWWSPALLCYLPIFPPLLDSIHKITGWNNEATPACQQPGAPGDLAAHCSLCQFCGPKLSRSPGEQAALSVEPSGVLLSTLSPPLSKTQSQAWLIYNSGMTFISLMHVVKSPSDKCSNTA